MIGETAKISIEKTTTSKIDSVDFNNIKFGKHFSDHMFVAHYANGQWDELQIVPYGNISVSPACAALHYGQAIFEGMKAYKNKQGEVLVFRPYENAKRINISAKRMCIPEIPEDLFMEALTRLLQLDKNWVPTQEGASLYIRPFIFASEPVLGVRPAEEYTFMIITSPVGSYYGEPVNVKIETEYSRAADGGVGFAKAAGNYGAALYPAKLGQLKGYHQLVWTDAIEHKYIEESGTMNVFFHINNKLITPSLERKTTLPGVTRDSIIHIAKHWNIPIEEKRVSVQEVIEAIQNGTLKDAFGSGTAATIAQIKKIHFNGIDYELPPIENRELSNKLGQYLDCVKRGTEPDIFNWVMKIV
ncbi:MAG: branched-chain amino acid aminotransferase [Flavobacteriales bacterium]|nr:branched-chain amino acid aminotransferase [Flavobacteriales bacterium]